MGGDTKEKEIGSFESDSLGGSERREEVRSRVRECLDCLLTCLYFGADERALRLWDIEMERLLGSVEIGSRL